MITDRYGNKCPPADGGHQIADHRNRRVPGCRGGVLAHRGDADHPCDQSAQADGHHAARNPTLEPHAAEIGEHDDAERGQTNDWPRERSEEEAE